MPRPVVLMPRDMVGSAFPEPKTARKNVSANGNGKGGGEVGVGK